MIDSVLISQSKRLTKKFKKFKSNYLFNIKAGSVRDVFKRSRQLSLQKYAKPTFGEVRVFLQIIKFKK